MKTVFCYSKTLDFKDIINVLIQNRRLLKALVEEMLSNYKDLGHKKNASLEHLQAKKDGLRATLKAQDLLKNNSVLISSISNPTACAVDGAYAIERLMSTDIVATTGLAIEGMTPPTETRHSERPYKYL